MVEATRSHRLKWPFTEKVVLVFGLFVALLIFIATQTSDQIRYLIFKTGLENLIQEPIGVVLDVKGNCERKTKGDLEFSNVKEGDTVYVFDTLVTQAGSTCSVSLVGNRTVQLGEDSLIQLSLELKLSAFSLELSKLFDVSKNSVLVTPSDRRATDALKNMQRQPRKVQVTQAKPLLLPTRYSVAPFATSPVAASPAADTLASLRLLQPLANTEIRPNLKNVKEAKISVPISIQWTKAEAATALPELHAEIINLKSAKKFEKTALQFKNLKFTGVAAVDGPGRYQVDILDGTGKTLLHTSFEVLPRIRAIENLKVQMSLKPTIAWKSVTHLSKTNGFTVTISDQKSRVQKFTTAGTQFKFEQFNPAMDYQVQIQAETPSGFILESETKKLSFDYAPPLITSPKEGVPVQVQQGKKTTITWNKTPLAVAYLLDVAADSGFTSLLASVNSPVNFAEFRFAKSGIYFVRVRVQTSYSREFTGPVRRFELQIGN